MNNLPARLIVYTKDVMMITGRRERAARALLSKIRKMCNKNKGALVSVEEFCRFTGLNEEVVKRQLV